MTLLTYKYYGKVIPEPPSWDKIDGFASNLGLSERYAFKDWTDLCSFSGALSIIKGCCLFILSACLFKNNYIYPLVKRYYG